MSYQTFPTVVQYLEAQPEVRIESEAMDHTYPLEESGEVVLKLGKTVYPIVFAQPKLSDVYGIVEQRVGVIPPAAPIAPTWTIRDQNRFGFTVVISTGAPDDVNYFFHYKVRVAALTE